MQECVQIIGKGLLANQNMGNLEKHGRLFFSMKSL